MSKPTTITINKADQKKVLTMFKSMKDARKIAKAMSLPHRHVMAFLESKDLVRYSEGSYR